MAGTGIASEASVSTLAPGPVQASEAILNLHVQAGSIEGAPILEPSPLGVLSTQQRTEVTFIESNVGDLPTLLKGLARDEAYVIDAGQDGLAEIARILSGRTGIDAVHIITHGAAGAVDLGALTLDSGDLAAHQADLAAIGASLSAGGDILLYGCDVGAGATGQVFIDRLAESTGADVAASSNLTGAASLGGDWMLEVASGHIDAQVVVDPALARLYEQVLQIPSVTVTFSAGTFSNTGGYFASEDVIYRVSGNSSYLLKIDGATEGAYSYGPYGNVGIDPSGVGETQATFSFTTGQVFTPTSIHVGSSYTANQSLIFKGYDTAGHQVGTTQTVTTGSALGPNSYVTANFSGLTNIAALKVTADPGSQGGRLVRLFFDDIAMTNVGPPAPTVTSITSTTANGAYTAGATIDVSVIFDSAVTVSGTPRLQLGTGGAGRTISYVSGSGSSTLHFTYTVQLGDNSGDLDVFDSSALTLNGGAIKAVSTSLDATLTLASPGAAGSLGANKNIVVDTAAPSAPSAPDLQSASDSGVSSTDNITNATRPVIVGTSEANATVRLYDTDGVTQVGSGTANGLGNWSITTSTLSAGAHTLTAKATDAAGNVSAAGSGLSVTIDTTAPTLAITSSVSSLRAGQTATITFTFSEDPGATFTAGDVTVSGGALGAISGTGLTRTSVFTPTANTDAGTATITVAAGSYVDAAGNGGGAGATPSLTFDTHAPNAPSVPDLAAGADSGASNTDDLTNVTTPTFTGTAEANATVRLYDTDGVAQVG